MISRYAKGTATGVNPGINGGATTHTHTSASHNHGSIGTHNHKGTTPTASGSGVGFSDSTIAVDNHAHSFTSGTVGATTGGTTATWNTANNDPSFFVVIWIKSDGTPVGLPDNCMALFDRATAPGNWIQHVGSKARFLKGATSGGDGGGNGGGSHVHTGISRSGSGNLNRGISGIAA